jgi:4-carboxymuconolactone decarboxylase
MTLTPLDPPYDASVPEFLAKWTPAGFPHPPLALFRLLVRHLDLASRVTPMASGLLNHGLLPASDRELLIARITGRLGAEYEWGIHALWYAPGAGLDPETLRATVHGAPDDPAFDPTARLLVRVADELLDDGRLSAPTLAALGEVRTQAQIVEVHLLCGWYRTLSTLMLSADLPVEPWADRFPAARPS